MLILVHNANINYTIIFNAVCLGFDNKNNRHGPGRVLPKVLLIKPGDLSFSSEPVKQKLCYVLLYKFNEYSRPETIFVRGIEERAAYATRGRKKYHSLLLLALELKRLNSLPEQQGIFHVHAATSNLLQKFNYIRFQNQIFFPRQYKQTQLTQSIIKLKLS